MRNAIAFACDANYAPFTVALASQIAGLNSDRNFDICIFSSDNLTIPSAFERLDLKLIHIKYDAFRNINMPAGRHGLAAYIRLLMPNYADDVYDRILYLDSDIICSGGDFNRLLSVDLQGHWLAAVRDNTQWRTPSRLNPEFRTLRRPARSYFNSGVLLIDIQEWHRRNIFRQGLDVLRHQSKAIHVVDQSILNIVANGCWAEMSPLWNWQYTRATRYFADLADPFLIHFIGPRKPWKDTYNALPVRFRRYYKSFLQDFWPSFSAVCDSIDPDKLGWPQDVGKSFIKHALSLRSMRNYLARFHDPYHIISLPDKAEKHRSFV